MKRKLKDNKKYLSLRMAGERNSGKKYSVRKKVTQRECAWYVPKVTVFKLARGGIILENRNDKALKSLKMNFEISYFEIGTLLIFNFFICQLCILGQFA